MASRPCLRHLRRLAWLAPRQEVLRDGAHCQCLALRSKRSIATFPQRQAVASDTLTKPQESLPPSSIAPEPTPRPDDTVLTTVYSFPDMRPREFWNVRSDYLDSPLRKDLLQKAIIYEGSKTRQGTASTKWRREVRGSTRKLYAQKGTGKARAGDKKSPIRRGGGVAFGPKPRDFSTRLPRKMYDKAWRIALSYRYRRGELIVVDQIKNLEDPFPSFVKRVFEQNGWGRDNRRSLLVPFERSEINNKLFGALREAGEHGRILELWDVDVKDLLEQGRVIIEQKALRRMLQQHSSDLTKPYKTYVPAQTRTAAEVLASKLSASAGPTSAEA